MKFHEKLIWGLGLTALLGIGAWGGHHTGLFKSSPIRKEVHQKLSNLSGVLYRTTDGKNEIELRRDEVGLAHKQLIVYIQGEKRAFLAVDRLNLFKNFGNINELHLFKIDDKGEFSFESELFQVEDKQLKEIEGEIDSNLTKIKPGLEQAIEKAIERREGSKKLREEVYDLLKRTGKDSYSAKIDGKDIRLYTKEFSYQKDDITKHSKGLSLELAHEAEDEGEKIQQIERFTDYKDWENGLERAEEFGLIDGYTNSFKYERLSEQKEIEMDKYLKVIKKELQSIIIKNKNI